MKILLGLIIGFVLLLVVLLALPFLIDLSRYQDQYRPMIESALNRQVHLQDIRLTVWPRLGVRVGGVTIEDDPAFSTGPFVSLTSLDVGVKILPLLSRRVEVDSIALRDPVVTIVTNRDGVMNVSTIGAAPSAAESPTPEAPPAPAGNPLQVLALFAVDHVSIEGGSLTYRDLTAGSNQEYQVRDLELLLTAVRLGQMPTIHLKATVLPGNLPVALDGRLGPLRETLELEQYDMALGIGKMALDAKGSLVGGLLEATLTSPAINTADLPLALPLQRPVQINDLLVVARAPVPFKQAASPLELADISNLSLTLGMGRSLVSVKGTVLNGQANVTVSAPSLNTADLPVAVPLAKPVDLKDLSITAKTRVPFQPTAPPLEIADVPDLRLGVVLGKSLVAIKGTVLNGQANVTVTSPSINTADLPVAAPLAKPIELRDLSVTAKTQVPFKPAAPPLELADVPDLRMGVVLGKSVVAVKGTVLNGQANVTLSSPSVQTTDLPVDTGLAKAIELKQILVQAALKGQEARLSNLSFQVFDGHVKGEGGLSLGSSAPPFRGKLRVDGLQLGPALSALSPDSKVSVSGTAAMDLALTGQGFTMPDLTKALEGPGHVRITNGKIEGIDLMEEAMMVMKPAGLSPDRPKVTLFSTIESDVTIKQGLVTVQKFLMDSRDLQATGRGTVGFDQALDLAMDLNLSQALSQRLAGSSPVAKLVMKDGRLKLPLLMTGTVQNPSYALDAKALTGKVQEQVQEKARETIKGLLEGTTTPKDLQEQGKDLLKGLLKR
jgi:AsmA protein